MDDTINVVPAQPGFYVVDDVAWNSYSLERVKRLEAKDIGVPVVAWLVVSSVKHGEHATTAEPITPDVYLRLSLNPSIRMCNVDPRAVITPDGCVIESGCTHWFSVQDFVMEKWQDAKTEK
jgi:hypothetical protein